MVWIVGLLFLSATEVYRCHPPGEAVLFTDRPCDTTSSFEVTLRNTVHIPQLTEAQRQQLAALSTQKPDAPRGAPKPSSAERKTLCTEARAALRGVQLKRRKGYSIAEATRLGAQEAKHRDQIRAHC